MDGPALIILITIISIHRSQHKKSTTHTGSSKKKTLKIYKPNLTKGHIIPNYESRRERPPDGPALQFGSMLQNFPHSGACGIHLWVPLYPARIPPTPPTASSSLIPRGSQILATSTCWSRMAAHARTARRGASEAGSMSGSQAVGNRGEGWKK